jgi:N-methylhydantoinase A/oxoprolinase/acetone carboxylase beta subunit
MTPVRVAIDTGGTFTDLVAWDGRRLLTRKVRSTPDDPSRAILQALEGLPAAELIHGSTVATNALLERKGARTAFVATQGFEDLLEIGRQHRKHLYDLLAPGRAELCPREWRHGLPERTLYDGAVETPLDLAAARRLARVLRRHRIESVAVCFLHSYANPANERALREALPGFSVSLSHEVLPEYREFERASTTFINAYVTPLMAWYLERLACLLPGVQLRVMQSNGGQIPIDLACRGAIQTIQSGPAGGVLGAAAVARYAGFERIISFDMGGTSTDVSLYDGAPSFTQESEIGDFPVRIPILDIVSVGAGGGSIAWIDAAGALRVGPQSAGADPGPACYGAGNHVTVTDANLYLGRIDPERFLSGRIRLDVDRAARSLEGFARDRGVAGRDMAQAIVDVANANMERAIRQVSLERGRDPRDFALVSFGGAGGLHACDLAARLDIATVLVPRHAGVLSALGMLIADVVRDYSVSVLGKPPEPAYAVLEERARAEFAAMGFDAPACERLLDLRYAGQSYEVTLPFAERHNFDAHHRRLYGYDHQGREVEAVTARLRVTAATAPIDLRAPSPPETFSSTYIPAGWDADTDAAGNLILRRGHV